MVLLQKMKEKKNECESIIPRDSNKIEETNYKCSLEKENEVDTCIRVKKECKDFKDPETCHEYDPADFKKCIFKNGNCIEEYKNCNLYDEKFENDQKKTFIVKELLLYINMMIQFINAFIQTPMDVKRKKYYVKTMKVKMKIIVKY